MSELSAHNGKEAEKSPVILAIDIGTTYAKVGIVDPAGNILRSLRERLELIVDNSGKAEHNVLSLRNTLVIMIKNVAQGFQDRVAAIVFSSYLFGLMAVDDDLTPLTNIITLVDTRARSVADELFGKILDPEFIYKRTGFPPTFHSPLAKIYWLSKFLGKNRLRKGIKFLLAKDFLTLTFTGKVFTDLSTASATSMLNVETLQWDSEILEAISVSVDQLSEIKPINSQFALTKVIAKECGMKEDTPVIIGTYDGGAVALSSGILTRRVCCMNMGTTSMARVLTKTPIIAGNNLLRIQNVALTPNIWLPGSSINNAGIIVQWFKKTFNWEPPDNCDSSFEERYTDSKLLVFPYLTGERGFLFGSNAYGTIIGLDIGHSVEHVYLATLEAVCFSLKLGLELLEESGVTFDRIVVSGGGSKSEIWLRTLSNITGRTVEVDRSGEPGLTGSAILGFHAVGFYETLAKAIEQIVKKPRYQIEPNAKLVNFYQDKYETFKKLLTKIYVVSCF